MKIFKTINKEHLNSNNTLFGGELMKWMDNLAHKAAIEFTGGRAVTSQVKELNFVTPVFEGDKIILETKFINSHGCLMEFKIDSYIIDNKDKVLNATALFIMVSINDNGRPQRIRN